MPETPGHLQAHCSRAALATRLCRVEGRDSPLGCDASSGDVGTRLWRVHALKGYGVGRPTGPWLQTDKFRNSRGN